MAQQDETVIVLIAAGLAADLFWGSWTRAAVTGLVVDLGDPAAGTLRDRLARALADPTLTVAYWLPQHGSYVDEAGQPLALPTLDNRVAGGEAGLSQKARACWLAVTSTRRAPRLRAIAIRSSTRARRRQRPRRGCALA